MSWGSTLGGGAQGEGVRGERGGEGGAGVPAAGAGMLAASHCHPTATQRPAGWQQTVGATAAAARHREQRRQRKQGTATENKRDTAPLHPHSPTHPRRPLRPYPPPRSARLAHRQLLPSPPPPHPPTAPHQSRMTHALARAAAGATIAPHWRADPGWLLSIGGMYDRVLYTLVSGFQLGTPAISCASHST